MSEPLTFANFSPLRNSREEIYDIGASEERPLGVARQIASAFEFDLTPTPDPENLYELIKVTGDAQELQKNIPKVQAVLGTSESAVQITRGWSLDSDLLVPVERCYMWPRTTNTDIDLVVVTGGVRNWMERRADRLATLTSSRRVGAVLLVAGSRAMKSVEGPNVEDGMTEADYMHDFIVPKLGGLGINTELIRVESGTGVEVMQAAAKRTLELFNVDVSKIAVVSNAGAWVQNAGQYLRAVQNELPSINRHDWLSHEFEAVSDSFDLGTGVEPTATHQNPFSAVGIILRNLQELTRHTD